MREIVVGQRIVAIRDTNNATTIASLTGFKNLELRQPQNEHSDYRRMLVDSRTASRKELSKVAAQINGIATWPERHAREDDILYTRVLRGREIDEFIKAYDYLSESDAESVMSGYRRGLFMKTAVPSLLVGFAIVIASFKWTEAMYGINFFWGNAGMYLFKKHPGKNKNYARFMEALQTQRNSEDRRLGSGWLYYSEKSDTSRISMNITRDMENLKAGAGKDDGRLDIIETISSLAIDGHYLTSEAKNYLNFVEKMSGKDRVDCPVMSDFLLRRGVTRDDDELVISFRSRVITPEPTKPAPDPDKKGVDDWAAGSVPTAN